MDLKARVLFGGFKYNLVNNSRFVDLWQLSGVCRKALKRGAKTKELDKDSYDRVCIHLWKTLMWSGCSHLHVSIRHTDLHISKSLPNPPRRKT